MISDSNSTSSGFTGVPTTDFHSHRTSARDLHRYIWGMMAVLSAFAISCPIACWRVSQSEQFRPYRSHVKSLTFPIGGSARE